MDEVSLVEADALREAALETVQLAVAVAGSAAALLHVEGEPDVAVGLAEDTVATMTARVRAALAGAGEDAAAPAIVAVPLQHSGGAPGFLAVIGTDGATSGALPAVQPHLRMLARGLVARRAQVRQEGRLARLASQVPGMLYQFRWDRDGRISFPYASERIVDIYGVRPEDVREDARHAVAMGHPDDAPRTRAEIIASARRLVPLDNEHRICLPDGRVRWLQLRAMPERLSDGGTLWHGFIADIDERKHFELRLRQSEEAFRHFFDAGLVGMTIAEPGRAWKHFNDRMCEMLGYTRDELQVLTWPEVTHPDDLAEDERHYARMLAGACDGYEMDKRYLRKDGSVLEARLAVHCERAADGGAGRVFAIVEDIGGRLRAERELQAHLDSLEQQVHERTREFMAARDAAQQASRAKTEFLSSMSHELRTPLNAILGFAQLMEHDGALGDTARAHLSEVMRAGRHLLRLINEVLDLAQVESGHLALSPEAVPLAALVQEALALSEPLARPRGITLHGAVPPALVVRADRMRLKQVLLNLVSNAIKYNRPGGRVDVDARMAGEAVVRLDVRDQGPGIPAAARDRLFQPFSRIGAWTGGVEGTGIGLALSRRLVSLMDGRIDVDDVPGGGSDFWVELPLGRLAERPAAEPAAVAAAPWAAPASLVLYVEDNPANLRLVEQIVARHPGVELISATDGVQGLALAQSRRPSLVLLDIHLPGMDGWEVLLRLRADPLTRAIPAVALTAQAMPHDARRAMDAGFDAFLSKPIDIAVFDAMLQRLLAADRDGTAR